MRQLSGKDRDDQFGTHVHNTNVRINPVWRLIVQQRTRAYNGRWCTTNFLDYTAPSCRPPFSLLLLPLNEKKQEITKTKPEGTRKFKGKTRIFFINKSKTLTNN